MFFEIEWRSCVHLVPAMEISTASLLWIKDFGGMVNFVFIHVEYMASEF